MKIIFKNILVLLFSLLLFATAFAQEKTGAGEEPQQQEIKIDFSDETLEKFIEASKSINEVQQEMEQKMLSVVEKEKMDLNRFNELAKDKQSNKNESNATEEELKSFERVVAGIKPIQEEMQLMMEDIMRKKEIEITEYMEIIYAYQQNEELYNRINAIMSK